MQSRQQLRQHYRHWRQHLSPGQQRKASAGCLQQLHNSGLLTPGKTVALYLANDGELNVQAVIEYCWQQGIVVVLPVLHPFCNGHLLFQRFTSQTQMGANRFGIAEPALSAADVVPLALIDIIFTPLVAFDAAGNRLGMGGGFYDRTLAPIEKYQLTTEVIGIAHHGQQARQLPVQSWDIPLHKIITDAQIVCLSPDKIR